MAALQGWELDWRAACKYDGIPAHNRWVQTGRKMFSGNQVTGTSSGLFAPTGVPPYSLAARGHWSW